ARQDDDDDEGGQDHGTNVQAGSAGFAVGGGPRDAVSEDPAPGRGRGQGAAARQQLLLVPGPRDEGGRGPRRGVQPRRSYQKARNAGSLRARRGESRARPKKRSSSRFEKWATL